MGDENMVDQRQLGEREIADTRSRVDQNIVVEQLKDLNGRLGQSKAERMRIESDSEQVKAHVGDPEALLQVPSLASLPAVAMT